MFPDKGSNAARGALRDLKNTAIDFTPSKIGSSSVDVTKTETGSQYVSLNNTATPKVSKQNFSTQNSVNSTKTDLDNWHENLMLSDDQFNFLFIEPSVGIATPTPSPERASELEYSHRCVELSTPTSGEVPDYKSTFDNDDYGLPCLDMSFFFR